MSKEFVVGDPYFLLSYLDKEYRFPVITSVIYLGMNLEDEGGEDDLWFFQDSESYLRSGPYNGNGSVREATAPSNGAGGLAGQVYDFPETQLKDILTIKELIDELQAE
jgi:hypothetical protein